MPPPPPPPPPPPQNFWGYFHALRQLLETKILIELLNIYFIDNTDLVLLLTCMLHEEIFSPFKVQTCPKKYGGGGGEGQSPPSPLPATHPFSYTSERSINRGVGAGGGWGGSSPPNIQIGGGGDRAPPIFNIHYYPQASNPVKPPNKGQIRTSHFPWTLM